jgi:hypothetical protein
VQPEVEPTVVPDVTIEPDATAVPVPTLEPPTAEP